MNLRFLPVLVAPIALVLASCGGDSGAAASSAAPAANTPAASAMAQPAASESAVAAESPTPSSSPASPTGCLDIGYRFKREFQDKGESYQSLWLLPNFTVTNNCDYEVKAARFSFTFTDAFGDEWPGGYTFKETLNLKPGKTWEGESTWGYQHYDSNQNYATLEDAILGELVPAFTDVVLVQKDGTKVTVE